MEVNLSCGKPSRRVVIAKMKRLAKETLTCFIASFAAQAVPAVPGVLLGELRIWRGTGDGDRVVPVPDPMVIGTLWYPM